MNQICIKVENRTSFSGQMWYWFSPFFEAELEILYYKEFVILQVFNSIGLFVGWNEQIIFVLSIPITFYRSYIKKTHL